MRKNLSLSEQERTSMDPQQSSVQSNNVRLQDNTGSILNEHDIVSERGVSQRNQQPDSAHRERSFSIAQVIPTPRSRSDNENFNENGGVSSNDADSDHGSTTLNFEEGEDYHGSDGFQSRNDSNYRSFRLNSNNHSFSTGTTQRNAVRIIPNQRRYTSFRLRRSECIYSVVVTIIIRLYTMEGERERERERVNESECPCACICVPVHDDPCTSFIHYTGQDQVSTRMHKL